MACVLKFNGTTQYAVMASDMSLDIGDTLEIKATANSGNDGGAYRILGRDDGFENLIELADADINVRIGNSANNKVSTNYTKPAVGVPFSFFLERLSSYLYEVRLDADTIGQISTSLDFKPNSVAGFNAVALFSGTIEYIKNGVVNNWDAASSDSSDTGLQPVMVDTIAGNNATGFNMPTNGDAWEGCGVAVSITVDSGTYNLSGTSIALQAQFTTVIELGSYSLSGTATGLRLDGNTVADNGSYSLSGTEAALRAASNLLAENGTYNLTGTDVTLIYTPTTPGDTLTIDSGTFSLTGATVGLVAARKTQIDIGNYALTGTSILLTFNANVITGSGSYALSGTDLALIANYGINVSNGSYLLSGISVTIKYSGDITQIIGTVTACFAESGISTSYKPNDVTATYKANSITVNFKG